MPHLSTLTLLSLLTTPILSKTITTNSTTYTYTYTLNAIYANTTFLSAFDFVDSTNPAGSGFASYVNESVAVAEGLINTTDTGAIRIGVDTKTVLKKGSVVGRKAVRLNSKIVYREGLFIADFGHVPGGVCGVWPAYWMSGPEWPVGGELDIIEGVNTNTHNKITGYTNGTGTCKNTGAEMTDTLVSDDCTDLDDTGCSMLSTLTTSYGTGFNTNNGGVYAVQWLQSTGIKVWFFPRDSIPSTILSSTPDPSTWGTPAANIPATDCDMATHFYDMQLVLNTNFCGGWTEQTWNSSGCGKKAASCEDWVRGYPEEFGDAYWDVNYIKTYEGRNVSSVVSNTTTSGAVKGVRPPVVFGWLSMLARLGR